jgi:hypothetical protein
MKAVAGPEQAPLAGFTKWPGVAARVLPQREFRIFLACRTTTRTRKGIRSPLDDVLPASAG